MRLLSKNIYKFNQITVHNDDALKIDNNEKVAKKIEYLEGLMLKEAKSEDDTDTLDGFSSGLNAGQVDALLTDDEGGSVIKAAQPEDTEGKDTGEFLMVASAQVKEMLEEARSEAEDIKSEVLAQAQQESEELKQRAFEEGKARGYDAGYNEGVVKIEAQRKMLEEERISLEKDYQELVKALEPRFIENLTDIYEKIFKVDLAKERDIIVHLISAAMHKIDGSSNYLIHVSKEDYSYVSMKKEELLASAVSPSASVEIVEDVTLCPNECMIETDGGIFDCGLGTQLEELSQKLRLLSYTKE
ncbi:flagellar assembly protein FliH [Kineothrix alysoides]|uniref:Flagellar assembly protein FliH n=1 Tax=Kineothrix alysoides TaxID=1469948 RepID=A0A4R1QRU4_9FIRM|nr:FliH/SctL family protein [Kineothrix alysoides]TCL56596.1 flagellar assembly protein FliH [Kineothrix alysoides]